MRIRDDKLDALLRPWMTEALKECDVNRFEFKGGEDYSGDEAVFVNITLNDGADTLTRQKESEIFNKTNDFLSEFDDDRFVYVKSIQNNFEDMSQEEFGRSIVKNLAEIRKVRENAASFRNL